jgi:hypothetical protein
MDLAFVRNQIELKLKEAETLLNIYTSGLEKEFASLNSVIEKSEQSAIDDLFNELKSISETINEIEQDFGIAVVQLTVLHSDIIKTLKSKLEERTKSRTTTFEDVTIVRQGLQYSKLADSIGYDKELKIMDIGYSTGSIYRYYNVPTEYFESLKTRNNLKGFKTEIAAYEVKKIK